MSIVAGKYYVESLIRFHAIEYYTLPTPENPKSNLAILLFEMQRL